MNNSLTERNENIVAVSSNSIPFEKVNEFKNLELYLDTHLTF